MELLCCLHIGAAVRFLLKKYDIRTFVLRLITVHQHSQEFLVYHKLIYRLFVVIVPWLVSTLGRGVYRLGQTMCDPHFF